MEKTVCVCVVCEWYKQHMIVCEKYDQKLVDYEGKSSKTKIYTSLFPH